ncbi:MarR family winged helix-turn-helix transcriptional regulator [Actinomadura rudentiformis]|uniref:MarR family transcriptional regulator n=1 Tax=Actinomadura rudentiformis TaxID=359158 RepID=A0A6H9YEU3_9ACTN|nr:MarR family transcriptional regulator [Actinomadura rudentiformis]KAB2343023.1 MarR family transcriptional regulator [Actinomadura rudentiformis]
MHAESSPTSRELLELVFQVAGRLREGFTRTAAELDLPPTQAQALASLEGSARMRDLAEVLACDASNVTGIVDGLERRGLVTRQPDPADRRVKHLVLTEEGERRRAALLAESARSADEVFDLPERDRLALRDLLKSLVPADWHASCDPRQ